MPERSGVHGVVPGLGATCDRICQFEAESHRRRDGLEGYIIFHILVWVRFGCGKVTVK
jgi:hypothetical protein